MSQYWKFTTIGDISEVVTKGTTPTSIGFKFTESGVNFVKVETITPNGQFLPLKFAHIDNDCNEALKRSQLAPDDILFSIAGALGRTAKVTHEILPANTNQALAIIRLKQSDQVMPEFILRTLSSGMLIEQIETQRGGVAQQNLSLAQVKNFQIPLPPLPEQKQIVAILDEAFEGIDRAIANTEKNLANSREIFESYLKAIFTQKRNGWVEKKLGDISEVQSGGTPSRSKLEYWSGETAWYSSGELNNLYTIAPERNITDKGLENSNAKLFPKGSLLIGMYDTAALKMSILDRKAAFNQAIAGVKPNEKIDLIFILHAINFVKPEILSLRRGVRQKNLSLQKIKDIILAIPELQEQKRVVQQLAAMRKETQRLETIYRQKIAALKELKQSILHKAFTGELTVRLRSSTTADSTKNAKEAIAA